MSARHAVIAATGFLLAVACSEDKGGAAPPDASGAAGRSDSSNTGTTGGATASTGGGGTSGGSSAREAGSKAGNSGGASSASSETGKAGSSTAGTAPAGNSGSSSMAGGSGGTTGNGKAGASGGTGGNSVSGGALAGATGGAQSTGGQTGTGGSKGVDCAAVTVEASGAYTVTFKSPAWRFSGSLGSSASGITTTTGSDKLGSYCDTSFTYSANGSRSNRIRAYASVPVVVFSESSAASVANTRNFPKLSSVPSLAHHITYGGGGGMDLDFINYQKTTLVPDSPFVYFDDSANTFILSGASHFPNTQTTSSGGVLTSGIQSNIATLPEGFEVSTILVADTSFNRAYESWGQALLSFTGKTLVANDATPVLGKFGYWTDNGATYYYYKGGDYQTLLKNVHNLYKENGVPLAYVQLDSWWYPKGANAVWDSSEGGYHTYEAHKSLFPDGLASFQKSLGTGLITHNRWLDANSPYRTKYKCSGNQVIDEAFWKDRAAYLKAAGVLTYEQDWLSRNGLPNQNNLTDQEAFLDNMAKAMGDVGIDIQYCMPLARHILQSTKYNSVTNSRVSSDRFDSGRYMDFFLGSRLAWAVRLWPWTDTFFSKERDNLLLSTLSAGLVGTGDALSGTNAPNFPNIKKVIRADGVIVKPDIPILLTDRSIVDDAKGGSATFIATTHTQHTDGRFTYLYAFNGTSASMAPSELGYTGKVYVYDVFNDSGKAMVATQANSWAKGYYLIAPIGTSGIAFLGDKGKFVPVGKKRVSAFTDDGTITAKVEYATGEGPVTIQGYAAASPTVTATAGTVGAVSYSATTQRFSVSVTAAGTSATISIKP